MSQTQETLPISVFIITLNEEKNIRRVLESCCDMDEIIVVDSGSTDSTVSIAKEFTDKVSFNEWPGYAKQKDYAMSLCSNEWVLNLDADEELTPELIEQFRKTISDDHYDAVRSQRNDIFIGKALSDWTKKPNNCRLYRKQAAHFDTTRLAHERADISGKELFVKEAFNHYGYGNIETITNKNNLYSSLKAQEKFDKGKSYSILKLLLVFPLIFTKTYIFQRHIFSGMRGFIISIMTAYYLFIKEAKLYEHCQNKKLEEE
ncbi:glycosyltransferase family 2 protein [Pleionea sp. CnH1-48]|uniref:glycosyltransferase family 2 protein n=1 Tax=Pleionea sp. CnH1-48 TaxID=2954494 RepID=UPI002096C08B|nr:glycosyltransferase family 2 protein [Pleionea sp. CnH1-48]MCO7227310.1 glycosyltransferase family 2 protein [Pleionea sp. CnH1-48]